MTSVGEVYATFLTQDPNAGPQAAAIKALTAQIKSSGASTCAFAKPHARFEMCCGENSSMRGGAERAIAPKSSGAAPLAFLPNAHARFASCCGLSLSTDAGAARCSGAA